MKPLWPGLLCAATLALCCAGAARAQEPPARRSPSTAPVMRVATGMHTTLIRRLAVDERGARLFTASDDKTIRIWRTADLRLLDTLRVPIDAGHEGQLLALAVSPDGTRVAAGGWTCWDWERAGCVYVFDTDSGELIQRVRGFPDAVGALAWSRDGRFLAVGLQGRQGLRVLRTDSFAEVAADRSFEDKVMELDYDARGRLAAVSLDGHLRVYRPDHRLHGRVRIAAARALAAVRFAPDGAQLAVAALDAPVVSLVNADTLATLATRRIDADPAQRNLSNLAWSVDGSSLYSAGERTREGPNILYRWRERGLGPMERFDIAALRVSDLQALANGSIAYAAEDPRIGIVDAKGHAIQTRVAEITDFAGSDFVLQASADGSDITFTASDGSPRRFSTHAATGQAAGQPPLRAGALLEDTGWQIDVDTQRRTLHVNGQLPRLDDYEFVRAHALTPARDALVLGTEWALRRLGPDAREQWAVQLASIVRAVLVSGDGQWVIAALSDGTIRWYRARDGSETLAYFPHANGEDWIAWTPAGYYMSSLQGDQYVGWHVNRGIDQTPDFHRAVQFERLLYRPDIVSAALRAGALPASRGLVAAERFDAARLAQIAPPRLAIRVLALDKAGDGSRRARIRITGERRAQALRDVTVYVNEIPITRASERTLGWTESNRFARDIEVPLSAASNEIRVESLTDVAMGVAERVVWLDGAPAPPAAQGDLYVLAIGNNAFPHLPPTSNLEFAARDAEALAAALASHGPRSFRRVHLEVFSDERARKADRQTVLDALAMTRRARAEDTVVVFLASHGVSDRAGNYWFVPRDATVADLEAVENSPPDRAPRPASLLSWSVFFDALRDTVGRRLLVVDTCQAKGMEGRFESFSLMKRSAASRFSLMVAAQSNEESQEYTPARHGLFTYALLQALSPGADTDRDGQLSIAEVFAAAAPVVARLHDRALGAQTPALIAPAALAASPLAASPLR